MDERGDQVSLRAGEVVFKEGDSGSCMYKILSGSALVYANYGADGEKLLTELDVGDYFGEMSVIEISPRSATVVAAKDGVCLRVIEADDLGGYLRENKSELNALARHLSERLRMLTFDYTEACDTLRSLGRLDTSRDRVGGGLLEQIKKFARFYLDRKKAADPAVPSETALGDHGKGFSLHLRSCRAGEVIFRERDASDCMFDIHSGSVGIYTGYGTPKQKLISKLSPNMFFGEMGLFEGLHRSATAVALEDDTRIEQIFEKDLAELYEENPAKVLMILQHLSSRLRGLTADYLAACRTMAETAEQLRNSDAMLTPEAMARIEYMNQLLLSPEVIY